MPQFTPYSTPAASLSDLWTKAETALYMKRTPSGLDKLCARDPSFPKPLKDGDNRRSRVYFVRQEVEAYLAGKLAARGEAA